jgi:HK97 family phage major capsid protein
MPTTTAVSQTSCLFGAFTKAGILADRGPVRLARSDDFKFQNDLIAFRATSRYDIQIHEPGNASAAGAYVGLVTAAS